MGRLKCFLSVAILSFVIPMKSQNFLPDTSFIQAGAPCEKMKYFITYDYAHVEDTTKTPYHPLTGYYWLEIGDRVSRFYSYDQYRRDSLNRTYELKGENSRQSIGPNSWQLYRNYPAQGQYALMDIVGLDYFACEEPVMLPEWDLVADSARTVLGYACHQAVTRYGGRSWTAWYADEIPLDEGPWKLKGLPGLVLQAYDSQGQFRFSATYMKQVADGRSIRYTDKGCEHVSKKDLFAARDRYHSDMVGYLTQGMKGTVKVVDFKGNAVNRKISDPYNPIELLSSK